MSEFPSEVAAAEGTAEGTVGDNKTDAEDRYYNSLTKEHLIKELKLLSRRERESRCELEVLNFIAYFVGADIPPPPIPSIWHKERDMMQQSMYSIIMAMKKKQEELHKDNNHHSFVDLFRSMLRWTALRFETFARYVS